MYYLHFAVDNDVLQAVESRW